VSAELPAALVADGIVLIAVALAAWVLPAIAMRMLVPALSGGPMLTNYRGRSIPIGLGLVWPIWVVLCALASELLSVIGLAAAGRVQVGVALQLQAARVFGAPAVLVLGAFALGFADDIFGTSAEKGFRGHLKALRAGRLTTGGLKLIGIGLFAAVAVTPAIPAESSNAGWFGTIGLWVLEVLAIALTANLVNLLDLRPGRALKGYSALVVPAVLLGAARWYGLARGDASAFVDSITLVLGMGLLLLGPIAAVWRYDLGEEAMLGDGGANPAGALAGFVVAAALPPWALAVYVVLVLGANLASERVSFSAVIAANRLLRWVDGLGRLPEPTPDVSISEDRGPTGRTDG